MGKMKKNKKKFKKTCDKHGEKKVLFLSFIIKICFLSTAHPTQKQFSASRLPKLHVFICCFVPCLVMDIEEAKKKNTQKVTLNYDRGGKGSWQAAHKPPVGPLISHHRKPY